ncbi:hypothetical protein [Methylobacterium sp. WL64]|nr:hypothetical protein [Methylobacterium sp. WL64]
MSSLAGQHNHGLFRADVTGTVAIGAALIFLVLVGVDRCSQPW